MEEHRQASREARAMGHQPPEPDAETLAEIRAWKKAASPIYRKNAKALSRGRSSKETVLLAEALREHERFYFPHMLDFRGRAYPIPSFLQPQGTDLAKGLLHFADGLPVTSENGGAGWLAVHLASMWGNDKVSLEDRIVWVEEREEQWRRIAADPMGNLEWSSADKPWQSLAAVFDWVGYLDHGDGYVSRLPVSVDGTCNGIQHLSALTRDAYAGSLVNLTPGPKPADIYKTVAEELQEDIERIMRAGGEEGLKAAFWMEVSGGELPRTLTKRQVMVLPYGGTRDSFFDYTREWLDTASPEPPAGFTDEERAWRTKAIAFMASKMWDRVGGVVRGGVQVMRWLQECAKAAALEDQPIFWTLPSGFVVRHFYGVLKERLVKLTLEGEVMRLLYTTTTNKLDTKGQIQGIAPNFIHSLDAAAMVGCINLCKQAGIEDFAAVHDSFGTHAANLWPLSRFIRQAFVDLHRADLLGSYRWACQRVIAAALIEQGEDPERAAEIADARLPPPLALGDLDIASVLESDYFFA